MLRHLRPDASSRGFAVGIYLEHLEEASFLYEQRLALLDDSEVPWPDLCDFEKRLEAHLDALALGGVLALSVCRQQAPQGDTGEYQATLSVICRHRRLDLLRAALEPLDAADDDRIRAAGDALSREMPPAWSGAIGHMVTAGHAGLRRIAARVIGFRRLSAVPQLIASVNAGGSYALPEVVWALGQLRAAEAHPVLWRTFEAEENKGIKKAAALALLRVGDRRVVKACLREPRRNPWLWSVAGLAGGRDDLRTLLNVHARGKAGPECLLAMGLLGDVSSIEPLMAALENEATAETAATALHLITGAELYERAVVPETPSEHELFEDEREGEERDGLTGSTVTQLTRDAARWKAWWAENASRFQPLVRQLADLPVVPLASQSF